MEEYTVSKGELPEENEKVVRFLKNNFFKHLNVVKMFGIEDEAPPDIAEVADFVVKAEDVRGRLIGVAYNTSRPNSLWAAEHSEGEKQIVEFFEYFEKQAGLEKLRDSVELWLLSVQEDWGGRGVARRLTQESERLARVSGYRMITMTCLNEYTARIAESLGWQEHYRIRYEDYPRLSGRDVRLKSTPPHHTLYFYVKEL